MRARDLIDRFGREEDAFLRAEFLAPVSPGAKVRVRIAGMVCELSVPGAAEGLFLLKPRSVREAQIVRPAGRAEAKRYLDLFPRARLIAAFRHGRTWLGLPAAAPAKGIRIEGWVPISLAADLRLFQTAVVRFDGGLFLLESTERPAEAAFLRDELRKGTPPDKLVRRALRASERQAYAVQLEFQKEMAKSVDERRIERALKVAGAEFLGFRESHGTFVVTWRVEGQLHESVISRDDLTVVSSGVCLSGRDRDFDLTSLVGVMRQRAREGHDDD
ncbi:MAG TPA: hypothetical protein VMU54_09180 [Planctomycetota bacterium]|nr:hypothetical protein [Planctomycetota bacterium]